MAKRRMSISRKKRRRQLRRRIILAAGCIVVGGGLFMAKHIGMGESMNNWIESQTQPKFIDSWLGAPPIQSELLDVNEYSRPGTSLRKVNGIVIHYVGNPNTTAIANRNYFNELQNSHTTQASSHFIVGLEGEIIQCVPTSEISYASNHRNSDTIAIECCHPDESGIFNADTYKSVVNLTGWLCFRYNLTKEDVIRHYDVTGKICPKYFVEHEDAWNTFLDDVEKRKQEIVGLAKG